MNLLHNNFFIFLRFLKKIFEPLYKKIVKIIISIKCFSFFNLNFEVLGETFKIKVTLGLIPP